MAAGLRYLGLGTEADTQRSWSSGELLYRKSKNPYLDVPSLFGELYIQHRIVQGSVWDPLDQLQSNQRQQLPTVSATEQPESTTLPPEKQMIYAIVNAFFNNITFQYPDAEELLTSGKDARGQQPERREAESVRSGGGIVSKSPSRNGYSQTDGMDTPTDASTSAGSPTPWQFENNSLPKITVPS